jgi:hypothetical protein
MIFEPWLLLDAAALADQTVAHLAATAVASLQNEVHMLFEEITDQAGWLVSIGINGGCQEV